METKALVTPASTVKLVRRSGMYVVLLDGATVNTSHSLTAAQLFARGVRREIQAKIGYRKSVAA